VTRQLVRVGHLELLGLVEPALARRALRIALRLRLRRPDELLLVLLRLFASGQQSRAALC
jgi:hypothetical protein